MRVLITFTGMAFKLSPIPEITPARIDRTKKSVIQKYSPGKVSGSCIISIRYSLEKSGNRDECMEAADFDFT